MKKGEKEVLDMRISPFDIKEDEEVQPVNGETENKHFYLEDYEDLDDFHRYEHQQIITPRFYTNEEYEKMNILTWDKKFNEMYKNHFRLEYLENHLQKSNPHSRRDNCNIVNILEKKKETFDDPEFTNIENLKETMNYSNVYEQNVKPTFWPPRVFDKNYKKLSAKESTTLSAQIEQYNIHLGSHKFEEPYVRNIYNHRSNNSLSITFSVYDFGTENDEDQTQWSDDALV